MNEADYLLKKRQFINKKNISESFSCVKISLKQQCIVKEKVYISQYFSNDTQPFFQLFKKSNWPAIAYSSDQKYLTGLNPRIIYYKTSAN